MLFENIIFPINFSLFGVEISSHLILYYIAVFVGIRYYFYLKKKNKNYKKISTDKSLSIIIGAIIGALIGSRIVALFEDLTLLFNSSNILYYFGVQTIVGGLIGGVIGIHLTKKLLKIKNRTGDNFTYPLILAIIIGRIGCFMQGVSDRTVGVVTNLPWGMNQGDFLSRHPTSIYEILFLIILWIVLKNIENSNKLKEGDLFKYFIYSYLVFRFLIEFIKPIQTSYFGISAIQIACLFGIIYLYLYNRFNYISVKN